MKSKPHGSIENTHQSTSANPAPEPQASAPATVTSTEPAKISNEPAAPATVATPAVARVPAGKSDPTESADTSLPAKEKAFFVQVKAKEDSWVSIVADGKSVMQRVLAADKRKKIKAGKSVILRTGNAGGIEVSFNGHPLGALGNENEPRTLTFNASGLVQ
jgi:cytoskeleton protein RodZ